MMDAPIEPSWATASNLARLEQRVTGLEKTLDEIKTLIVSLRSPQYTVIASFAGVVLLAASYVYNMSIGPIQRDIERLYSAANRTELKIDDNMKIVEARAEKKLDREAFDSRAAALDAAIQALNKKLKRE